MYEPGRDTKKRILDAAERLFAEHGFDRTSMREVTSAAGANLGAITYYFGSKTALLGQVCERVFGSTSAEQLRRLDELEAHQDEPAVEELLDAFLAPIFETLGGAGERGEVITRLAGRIMWDPGQEFRAIANAEFGEVSKRYFAALRRALPHLPDGELWWRFCGVNGVLAAHQTGMLAELRPSGTPAPRVQDHLAWAVAFLSAALRAPSADPSPAGANA